MFNKNCGFTLVEAIITALILSIIAGMAMAQKKIAVTRMKEYELRQSLALIRRAIDEYKEAVDKKVIIKDASLSTYPPSLAILETGIKTSAGKELHFLRRLPRDPFNNNPMEKAEETWNIRSSTSPPGDFSEEGDVYDISSKSEDIGLNGIPYKDW